MKIFHLSYALLAAGLSAQDLTPRELFFAAPAIKAKAAGVRAPAPAAARKTAAPAAVEQAKAAAPSAPSRETITAAVIPACD